MSASSGPVRALVKRIAHRVRVNAALARLVNRPLILAFHRIKEPDNSILDRRVGATSPAFFESMLEWLSNLGYTFVSLDELSERLSSPRPGRVLAITFDDGFKDLYQNAFPILARWKAPFTMFGISSIIGAHRLLWLHKLYLALDRVAESTAREILKECSMVASSSASVESVVREAIFTFPRDRLLELVERMATAAGIHESEERSLSSQLYLDEAEIKEMQGQGMTIEAHGHEHWVLSGLDREDTRKEVSECVRILERKFLRRPRFYCLAFGRENPDLTGIVRELELEGVCTTDQELVRAGPRPMKLSRMSARDLDLAEFSWVFTRNFIRELRRGQRSGPGTVRQ